MFSHFDKKNTESNNIAKIEENTNEPSIKKNDMVKVEINGKIFKLNKKQFINSINVEHISDLHFNEELEKLKTATFLPMSLQIKTPEKNIIFEIEHLCDSIEVLEGITDSTFHIDSERHEESINLLNEMKGEDD